MDKTLLIDFNNLWNRYFHALVRNKKDTEQLNTFVIRIKDMLEHLNSSENYNKIFLILDGENCNESKKQLLESYKGNRLADKSIIYHLQKIILRDFILPNMKNLHVFRANEYEADHIISITAYNLAQKSKVDIYSSDKDLLQTLTYSPNISIGHKLSQNILIPYTFEEILKKFKGISNYSEILKYRTFKGDTSDNIPPAIPHFPTKLIFTLIREVWTSPVLSPEILGAFSDFTSKITPSHYPLLERNWTLMYLNPHIPIPQLNLKRLKPSNSLL